MILLAYLFCLQGVRSRGLLCSQHSRWQHRKLPCFCDKMLGQSDVCFQSWQRGCWIISKYVATLDLCRNWWLSHQLTSYLVYLCYAGPMKAFSSLWGR